MRGPFSHALKIFSTKQGFHQIIRPRFPTSENQYLNFCNHLAPRFLADGDQKQSIHIGAPKPSERTVAFRHDFPNAVLLLQVAIPLIAQQTSEEFQMLLTSKSLNISLPNTFDLSSGHFPTLNCLTVNCSIVR